MKVAILTPWRAGGKENNFGSDPTFCEILELFSKEWFLNQTEWNTLVKVQMGTYTVAIDCKLTCILRGYGWFQS
jgi:hypothetical protein